MIRRMHMFARRLVANWRARRAQRRLVSRGVLSRVAEAQKAMASTPFTNVFRKEVTARMKAGRPMMSAQDIADLVVSILTQRWKLDIADVQFLVELDETRTKLGLTASPSIRAVELAHGGARG
jgi:NADP-dependent 3-hydroxy acid dehydrogenase YdfG